MYMYSFFLFVTIIELHIKHQLVIYSTTGQVFSLLGGHGTSIFFNHFILYLSPYYVFELNDADMAININISNILDENGSQRLRSKVFLDIMFYTGRRGKNIKEHEENGHCIKNRLPRKGIYCTLWHKKPQREWGKYIVFNYLL